MLLTGPVLATVLSPTSLSFIYAPLLLVAPLLPWIALEQQRGRRWIAAVVLTGASWGALCQITQLVVFAMQW